LNKKFPEFIYGVFSVLMFLIIWEFFYKQYSSNVLPPPSQFIPLIWEQNFNILGSNASFSQSIFASIFRVLSGLTVGFIFAIITGIIISSSKWVRRLIFPIIQILAPIAPIVWVPITLVILGIGNIAAILIVFLAVYFVLTVAMVRAIETVPQNLINAGKTLGANGFKIWRNVIFPFTLPSVFMALRINFIGAWMAVLVAEMTGINSGLGTIIMLGRSLFNYEIILLGTFLIGSMGYLFDTALVFIQKKYFWWENK
jgi:NitT/TauT family transport system permease protein